ncbi:MAG: ArnT family glycosyltransferase [Dehalococcoidia bacterium]
MDAGLPTTQHRDDSIDRAIAYVEERRVLVEVVALTAAIVIFLISVMPNLANHPAVTDDEIWVLSASYKLANEGVFGSDMFAGFYNADKHYFFNMPLHHFVVAGVIKVLGAGVAEARFASVLYGIATIFLTYAIARKVAGVPVALLSLGLLLFLRLNIGFDTGLPLQELSSNMRYDLAPVPFMLGGVLLLLNRVSLGRCLMAGALFGIAFLLQFYGAFIIPAVIAYLWLEPVERRERLKLIGAMIATTVIVVLPYAGLSLAYYDDFKGQAGTIDQRADFSDPGFYIDNLKDEPDRFLRPLAFKEIPRGEDPRTTPPQFLSLSETLTRRPSAKLAVIVGLPAALIFMAFWAVRDRNRGYQMLVLCLAGLVAEFALLDQTKFLMYWIPVVPFLSIGMAAVSWWLLSRVREGRVQLAMGGVAAALLLLIAAEGSVARLSGIRTANQSTNYASIGAALHETIPPGSKVVGSTSMWWGMRDMDYRSYFLFFYLTRDDAGPYKTTITGFLDDFQPDYVVLTGLAWGELEDHLIKAHYDELLGYLDSHATIVRTLQGPEFKTYGYIEVWQFR